MDPSTNFYEIVAVAGVIGTFAGIIVSCYYGRKSSRCNRELKRFIWSDLESASRGLRNKIKKKFRPDIVFTPCRRGAAVANLMFEVGENIILYVGIREDRQEKKFDFSSKEWKKDWEVVETEKYFHYIPKAMLKERNANLLILDDFAMSGTSLKNIVNFLLDKGFSEDNIKTATIVCTDATYDAGRAPDFWWKKTPYTDFEFPWGRAR